MNFTMNNQIWEIKEISNAEMNIICGSDLGQTFTHGVTRYSEFRIYINDIAPDKKTTLYHELMHCFMYEFGHNQQDRIFNNEDICEISACSHDIIHKIVENWENFYEKE